MNKEKNVSVLQPVRTWESIRNKLIDNNNEVRSTCDLNAGIHTDKFWMRGDLSRYSNTELGTLG